MNQPPETMNDTKPSPAFRLLRLAFIALLLIVGVVMLVWLGWIILPWIALPALIEPRVRELGRVGNWSAELIAVVTVFAVVVGVFFFRRVFTRNPRKHWTAVSVLAGLVVVYLGMHAWFGRGHIYRPTGEPAFYWGLTPQGTIHKQSEPGLNPYTRKPLSPASPDYLALIRSRLLESLVPVNPAVHVWFDPNTGWPMLWYYRNPEGQIEFYTRPAIHPRYQVELLPVTVELRRAWEQEQNEHRAAELRQAAEAQRQLLVAADHLAAEQQQQLEIEQARVAAERLQTEAAEREAETVAAREREEAARQAEAERLSELARRAEQHAQEQQAAAERRRQSIIERRTREAAAPIIALDWLSPAQMIGQLCPDLTAESFQLQRFADDYAGRRFRHTGRVAQLLKSKQDRIAVFEVVTVGEIHLLVRATLQGETVAKLRTGREASIAGTVAALRLTGGFTNINGLRGQLCILELGNTEGYVQTAKLETIPKPAAAKPVAAKQPTEKKPAADPLFAPMSEFSGNPPVAAAFGYTFENSVRLVFSPLRLFGRSKQPTVQRRPLPLPNNAAPPPAVVWYSPPLPSTTPVARPLPARTVLPPAHTIPVPRPPCPPANLQYRPSNPPPSPPQSRNSGGVSSRSSSHR